MWTINATTTQAAALVTDFLYNNFPQAILLTLAILGALFIFVLVKSGIRKVWRNIKHV